MANRFWVGGTGTWDSTSTTNWAATTGGASGASAPVAGDNITFDANSGAGTITAASSIDSIAFGTLTATALTGSTLAFNTNNPNMSFTSVDFSGSGTRTINLGSGTWTLTGTSGNVLLLNGSNITPTFNNATINFTGSGAARTVNWGTSLTYGAIIVGANSAKGAINFTATTAVTFASITVSSGNTVMMNQGITSTISGALSMTGTSSAPVGLISNSPVANVATVSVGSASTIDWGAVLRITKAGAGSITATNSLDLGGNTSVTITAPSGGGVVGVIGG